MSTNLDPSAPALTDPSPRRFSLVHYELSAENVADYYPGDQFWWLACACCDMTFWQVHGVNLDAGVLTLLRVPEEAVVDGKTIALPAGRVVGVG